MRYASITDRLADLGGEKWLLYSLARQMAQDGRDIIEMTIGEPDVPTPPELIAVACDSMMHGRTKIFKWSWRARGFAGAVKTLYCQRGASDL